MNSRERRQATCSDWPRLAVPSARCIDGLALLDASRATATDDQVPALEAFADAIRFPHEQLNRSIDDHQSGEHSDRPIPT
jgi:hypothetical protein